MDYWLSSMLTANEFGHTEGLITLLPVMYDAEEEWLRVATEVLGAKFGPFVCSKPEGFSEWNKGLLKTINLWRHVNKE
jgi:hypothetical protein